MKAPGEKQIIQIIVTSYCDLACSNCTQLIGNQGTRYHMSPDNFRRAVVSLLDYPGIVGVFGGNPCLHPQFNQISAIMRELLPKERRGLWTNWLAGQDGEMIRDTYGYLNLVVHGNTEAGQEMRAAGLSLVHGEGKMAWHSPILIALLDIIPDRAERLKLIETCDINLRWSGAIDQGPLPGIPGDNLRGWYCEVASSMARAYKLAGGIPLIPGWWAQDMRFWKSDVDFHCHRCGVPLKLKGQQDNNNTDDYSPTHGGLINLRRKSKLHTVMSGGEKVNEVTDYMRLKVGQ